MCYKLRREILDIGLQNRQHATLAFSCGSNTRHQAHIASPNRASHVYHNFTMSATYMNGSLLQYSHDQYSFQEIVDKCGQEVTR
jgi:hypothetical protein